MTAPVAVLDAAVFAESRRTAVAASSQSKLQEFEFGKCANGMCFFARLASQILFQCAFSNAKILDENKALLRACIEFQNAGKLNEVVEFQKRLHQNLVFLGIAYDEITKVIFPLCACLCVW